MAVCVSTEVMRNSDRWTIENLVPSKELMARAGKAIFDQVSWKGPVGIICGKGNNAGDGFVVASLLKDQGIDCEIVLLYRACVRVRGACVRGACGCVFCLRVRC